MARLLSIAANWKKASAVSAAISTTSRARIAAAPSTPACATASWAERLPRPGRRWRPVTISIVKSLREREGWTTGTSLRPSSISGSGSTEECSTPCRAASTRASASRTRGFCVVARRTAAVRASRQPVSAGGACAAAPVAARNTKRTAKTERDIAFLQVKVAHTAAQEGAAGHTSPKGASNQKGGEESEEPDALGHRGCGHRTGGAVESGRCRRGNCERQCRRSGGQDERRSDRRVRHLPALRPAALPAHVLAGGPFSSAHRAGRGEAHRRAQEGDQERGDGERGRGAQEALHGFILPGSGSPGYQQQSSPRQASVPSRRAARLLHRIIDSQGPLTGARFLCHLRRVGGVL